MTPRWRIGWRLFRLLLALIASITAVSADAADRPSLPLQGRVTDAAHLLDAATVAALTERLWRLEAATGHQLVVVTVTTLHGQDVTVFTRRLGIAWGIGRAGINNGVILLVAPNERRVRIAVGTGLEAALPDAACSRIITRTILPRFRTGDLRGGIVAGTDALIRHLSRATAAPPAAASVGRPSRPAPRP